MAQQQLDQLWRDLEWAERRCGEVGAELKRLYDQARELDPRLPAARPGVVSRLALARLVGELGPLSDFQGWRELLRYVGLNLRERQSGQFVGQIRITRKGRPELRLKSCLRLRKPGARCQPVAAPSDKGLSGRPEMIALDLSLFSGTDDRLHHLVTRDGFSDMAAKVGLLLGLREPKR